jgi:hypothetical protein
MPKGYKTRKTRDKEAMRAAVREVVNRHLEEMLASQIANAKGFKYLVVRQKNGGKFLRVTEAMAKIKLGNDEEIVEVWEKDPNAHAFATLLDQAIDQAPKHVQVEANVNIVEVVMTRLLEGRKRVANASRLLSA